MKKQVLAGAASLVFGLAASGSALAWGGGTSDPYASSGSYTTTSESGGYSCTIYRPRSLSSNHPIILWGNGTGTGPSSYGQGLSHWASHGFVVAAANTSNAGTGEEMLGCLNYLISQNSRYGSTYYGRLNTARVGTSGHSQGGGGAIMAGTDSRITATAPMQPYTIGLGHDYRSQYNQNGPMFLMSGSSDTIASPSANQEPVFRRANVPVFWGTLRGASHFEPMGDFGGYRGPSTAWFAYHLKGDTNARSKFYGSSCGLCNDSNWSVQRKGM
jgi:hypothetical protein